MKSPHRRFLMAQYGLNLQLYAALFRLPPRRWPPAIKRWAAKESLPFGDTFALAKFCRRPLSVF